jgi:hypothetical protein
MLRTASEFLNIEKIAVFGDEQRTFAGNRRTRQRNADEISAQI